MACVKRFICALVALSFIFAGVPVQAKSIPCPMEKMKIEMQISSSPADIDTMKMDMKDCDKCPKSAEKKQAEQKTKKSGCCDDATCNAKCAALSSSSTLFPAGVVSFSPQMACGEILFLPYLMPPSHALKTPEKPPKHLS